MEIIGKQYRYKLMAGLVLCAFALSGCGARELKKYQGAEGEPQPVSVLKAGGKWPLPGVGSGDFAKAAGLVAAIESPPIGGSLMGGALDVLGTLGERREYVGSFILYFAPRASGIASEDVRLEMIGRVREAVEEELTSRGLEIPVREAGVVDGVLEYRIHDGECDWETWFCMVRVIGHQEPAIGYSPPGDGGFDAWVGFMPIANGKGTRTGSKWKAAFPDLSFWIGVSARLPDWAYIYLQPNKASVFVDGSYAFLQAPAMLSGGYQLPN